MDPSRRYSHFFPGEYRQSNLHMWISATWYFSTSITKVTILIQQKGMINKVVLSSIGYFFITLCYPSPKICVKSETQKNIKILAYRIGLREIVILTSKSLLKKNYQNIRRFFFRIQFRTPGNLKNWWHGGGKVETEKQGIVNLYFHCSIELNARVALV